MAKPKSRWEDVVLVISRAMIYNIEFEGVTFLKSGEAVAVLYLVISIAVACIFVRRCNICLS